MPEAAPGAVTPTTGAVEAGAAIAKGTQAAVRTLAEAASSAAQTGAAGVAEAVGSAAPVAEAAAETAVQATTQGAETTAKATKLADRVVRVKRTGGADAGLLVLAGSTEKHSIRGPDGKFMSEQEAGELIGFRPKPKTEDLSKSATAPISPDASLPDQIEPAGVTVDPIVDDQALTTEADPDAKNPDGITTIAIRAQAIEAELAEARIKLDTVSKDPASTPDDKTGASIRVQELENRLAQLKLLQDGVKAAEAEDARPLEERLDEARHQVEELNRLIKEAQRIGDTESMGKLQLEQQSIAGRYTSLLGNADEKFRERYLEKIEKEKKKKEKGPLWKRLLRILRDSLIAGSGSVVSSVGSDLREAATEPPPQRR